MISQTDGNYFFDTYAIMEILKSGPNYACYADAKIVLTIFNLVELHYKLLRDFDETLANKMLQKYSKFSVDIDLDTIREANKFKLINKKQNLSVPDAIGYITAKKFGIKFLTGDNQFKNFENVEFVK